jgi:hypothetical protein
MQSGAIGAMLVVIDNSNLKEANLKLALNIREIVLE